MGGEPVLDRGGPCPRDLVHLLGSQEAPAVAEDSGRSPIDVLPSPRQARLEAGGGDRLAGRCLAAALSVPGMGKVAGSGGIRRVHRGGRSCRFPRRPASLEPGGRNEGGVREKTTSSLPAEARLLP